MRGREAASCRDRAGHGCSDSGAGHGPAASHGSSPQTRKRVRDLPGCEQGEGAEGAVRGLRVRVIVCSAVLVASKRECWHASAPAQAPMRDCLKVRTRPISAPRQEGPGKSDGRNSLLSEHASQRSPTAVAWGQRWSGQMPERASPHARGASEALATSERHRNRIADGRVRMPHPVGVHEKQRRHGR